MSYIQNSEFQTAEVVLAMLKGLQHLCTPNIGRPPIGTEIKNGPEPACDQQLLQHMAEKVFVFYADAAGNEMVAGETLKEKQSDGTGALLPSLTLVGRAATAVLRVYSEQEHECIDT